MSRRAKCRIECWHTAVMTNATEGERGEVRARRLGANETNNHAQIQFPDLTTSTNLFRSFRTCTCTVLYTYTYVYVVREGTEVQSTFVLSYFRTFVRKYFRTFVPSVLS